MRYKQEFDGEWIQPRMKNYYLKCCSCGLVHRIDFRLAGDKRKVIQFKAVRLPSRKTSGAKEQ